MGYKNYRVWGSEDVTPQQVAQLYGVPAEECYFKEYLSADTPTFLIELWSDPTGEYKLPVKIDPRWLTSTVVDLSQSIFNGGKVDLLPWLADALVDAGCDEEEWIVQCQNKIMPAWLKLECARKNLDRNFQLKRRRRPLRRNSLGQFM